MGIVPTLRHKSVMCSLSRSVSPCWRRRKMTPVFQRLQWKRNNLSMYSAGFSLSHHRYWIMQMRNRIFLGFPFHGPHLKIFFHDIILSLGDVGSSVIRKSNYFPFNGTEVMATFKGSVGSSCHTYIFQQTLQPCSFSFSSKHNDHIQKVTLKKRLHRIIA